jgi:hypothetical protein
VKLEDGDWVKDIPEMEDLELLVKGVNNSRYRSLQRKLIAAVPRARRATGLTDDDSDRIMTECLLQTCLLDWRNLLGDDGKQIPFSKEAARALMFDPAYKSFHDAVLWAATMVSEQRAQDIEAAAKN